MKVPHPVSVALADREADERLLSLSGKPGVYCLHFDGAPSHLSSCRSLGVRVGRLLRSGLSGLTRADCWPTYSKLETALLLYALSKDLFPDNYRERLKLRLPWFVALGVDDPFPRLLATGRLRGSDSTTIGPFASRDEAEHYCREVLALYQLRQCSETLEPSPDHPGCIYGEMNHCLRPCQAAVSPAEYATEAQRVSEFLQSNGRNLLTSLSMARDRAAAEMEFEQAAEIHKRMERAHAAADALPAWAGKASTFSGVALVGGPDAASVRLFLMSAGAWQGFADLSVVEDANRGSLDTRLRELLSGMQVAGRLQPDVEHMAIFLRWYRSTWCDGEWFPFETIDRLNYRKLVRAISKRVQQPTAPPAPC